ncbi:hypothetical protein FRZ67_21370 [Panacibacter ginsenosidivorans]|uniref:Uncharacterized protein n=1 Tax=Panacibacter ginsenosidivorans TaxID=1813871 RepID=A0A5B8VF57_9BACT|nr:hypothetical protein [Panacibacter ginsenosidivorans]QEC69723.1 hypothetical protein FRZ67_21370 [Panacibacter ginsenosidivorans]
MKQAFKISKKIDAAYAGKVLFALEQSGIFHSVQISVATGDVEINADETISIEQVEELLAEIKDLKIEEKKNTEEA